LGSKIVCPISVFPDSLNKQTRAQTKTASAERFSDTLRLRGGMGQQEAQLPKFIAFSPLLRGFGKVRDQESEVAENVTFREHLTARELGASQSLESLN
jgi:hypothetical protein